MILCIYRCIFLLNTLSGGKSCLVAPGVALPPWATETVLSLWLAADEVRYFHTLYDGNISSSSFTRCMMEIYHLHHHHVMLLGRISRLSLVIRLYHPSLSADPQNYILFLYRAVVDRFCWSSNTCTSMGTGPLENNAYEFILTFTALSCMFRRSNFDGYGDRR